MSNIPIKNLKICEKTGKCNIQSREKTFSRNKQWGNPDIRDNR